MSNQNIFQEIDEDLERQKLETLWKNYGKWVVAVAVVIVLGSAGTTMWNSWQSGQHQAATDGLIEVMTTQANADQTKQIEALVAFADKNGGSSQASFARLQAASMAVKEGQKDKAVQLYDSLAQDKGADPAFRQLADLLAVQTQIDSGNPAELDKRLQPLTNEDAPWRYTAKEYQGYLAIRAGDKARAQQLFTALSQDMSAPETLRTRATDMLHIAAE
ncbi:MAG: tetratricopeptide repeat protein [Alphaproteobacteria bacterium]|nr:tetratricopeptide repeat protein [Alphaproteobacteria bacterium]